jgi:uncharacterized protein YecE (DUF72 family)
VSATRCFVGPAGFSYADWEGIVYPTGLGPARLDTVARLFDLIEINTTFYGPLARATAEDWVARVRARAGFRFTVKLTRRFTHDDPKSWTLADRDDFADGIAPLAEAGLLGPILCQFPFFFEAGAASLVRLARIRKAFPERTLVLEVRDRSWIEEAQLRRVRELGYSFCNVDQPLAATSIPLGDLVTGPIGYLRLHGRNAPKWFDRKAAVHEKYDWLYSEPEVAAIVQTAARIRARTEELYVVANNHFAGKGPANALEIAQALTGACPEIPESLVRTYPRLARLSSRPAGGAASRAAAPEAP